MLQDIINEIGDIRLKSVQCTIRKTTLDTIFTSYIMVVIIYIWHLLHSAIYTVDLHSTQNKVNVMELSLSKR